MKGDELTKDPKGGEAPGPLRNESSAAAVPAEEFVSPDLETADSEFVLETESIVIDAAELSPLDSEDEREPSGGEDDGPYEADAEDDDDEPAVDDGEGPAFEDHDPFAPAYDLEKGEPIRDRQSRTVLPHRAKIRSAREFFSTEILYRHDILIPEDRSDMVGTYRVELKGYRGGVWTMKLGEEISVVNRREDADVVVIMQQRDFLSLVNGDLNPQLAILAKKMRITGDLKRAVALQALFAPAAD